MFNSLISDSDSVIRTLQRNCDLHNHYTMSNFKFNIPLFKKSRSQQSILYTGVKIWNELPVSVSGSLNTFKTKIEV